mmetsp:Transcript_32937/g.84753  ORF Transcript_32937/g.84753 Transcript_32937/m.84753 type:complete len:136 (+) Transcript_32937:656-1063(+)
MEVARGLLDVLSRTRLRAPGQFVDRFAQVASVSEVTLVAHRGDVDSDGPRGSILRRPVCASRIVCGVDWHGSGGPTSHDGDSEERRSHATMLSLMSPCSHMSAPSMKKELSIRSDRRRGLELRKNCHRCEELARE